MNDAIELYSDKAKILKTIKALEKRRISAYYAESRQEAFCLAKKFLSPGISVAVGGSVTLREVELLQYIENGDFVYTNRYKAGVFEIDNRSSEDRIRQSYLDAYTADVYFSGSNAITEKGEIFNVDGQGNRVSALSFGPKQVVILVGRNKIVPNLEAAWERVRKLAAPANNMRYRNSVPCTKTGFCVDCRAEERSCCNYLLIRWQRKRGRMHVILIDEDIKENVQ